MGCWSVYCGISQIAITAGDDMVLLPLKKSEGYDTYLPYLPATLPIFGEYDDYGGIENIVKDGNTALIEEHFGVSIEDFAMFLLDGKQTYDRTEAKTVAKKMLNGDEAKDWKFMFINRKVYDFCSKIDPKEHEVGTLNFGTKEMLTYLGFEFVAKSDKFKTYDPKRFNEQWKLGDTILYSDGKTLLHAPSNYIMYFDQYKESGLTTYVDVAEDKQWLRTATKESMWRMLAKGEQKTTLGWVIGADRYGSMFDNMDEDLIKLLEELKASKLAKKGVELPKREPKPKKLLQKYMDQLDSFGDILCELINIRHNIRAMSGRFDPFVKYLTPQCGERENHQRLLEAFAAINKELTDEIEEDEEV